LGLSSSFFFGLSFFFAFISIFVFVYVYQKGTWSGRVVVGAFAFPKDPTSKLPLLLVELLLWL
jgi:hypothetical protein